jgi:hypothetical protein
MRMMLIGGGLLFLCIVAGVVVLTKGGKAPVVAHKPVDRPPPPPVKEPGRIDAAFATEAESLARRFLSATTVDDMLGAVRNPEVAEARMRAFYPEGKIAAPGLSQFNSANGAVTRGKFYSFPVITSDQVEKSLAFVETPQGLRIDWESWVGWSEMPWQEFLSAKPAASHVFRVILAPVDYYNFGFSDDTKWQCYRLESPDREHAVYGYVERDSRLDVKLRPSPGEPSVLMTLALKFPPDSKSGTQVEIERLVSEGWVEEGGAP